MRTKNSLDTKAELQVLSFKGAHPTGTLLHWMQNLRAKQAPDVAGCRVIMRALRVERLLCLFVGAMLLWPLIGVIGFAKPNKLVIGSFMVKSRNKKVLQQGVAKLHH